MKLITQREAADILRCHPSTIAKLRKAGKFRSFPGNPIKIPYDDFRAWIEQTLWLHQAHIRHSTPSVTGLGSSVTRMGLSTTIAEAKTARADRRRASRYLQKRSKL